MNLLTWEKIYQLLSRDAANPSLPHVEAGEPVLEALLRGSQRPEMDRQDRLGSAIGCVPRRNKTTGWLIVGIAVSDYFCVLLLEVTPVHIVRVIKAAP